MPNRGAEILAEDLASAAVIAVQAVASGTQSIANNTGTMLQFAAADIYDLDTMHNPAVNNTRVTIFTPGWYLFHPDVTWASSPTGKRQIYIARTRAGVLTFLPFGISEAASPTDQHEHFLTAWDQTLIGDFYEVNVTQTSGSAKIVTAAYFSVIRLGS